MRYFNRDDAPLHSLIPLVSPPALRRRAFCAGDAFLCPLLAAHHGELLVMMRAAYSRGFVPLRRNLEVMPSPMMMKEEAMRSDVMDEDEDDDDDGGAPPLPEAVVATGV